MTRSQRKRQKQQAKLLLLGLFGVVLILFLVLIILLISRLASNGPEEGSKAPAPQSSASSSAASSPSSSSGASSSAAASGSAEASESTQSADITPPLISGAHDINIFVGQSIAYFDGVTATDDTDPAPSLTVDADSVNLREPGFYFATYTARDQSGNISSAQIQVVVQSLSEAGITDEDVRPLAEEILREIITPGMSDTQKAKAIFDWTINTIYYLYDSDERDLMTGAYAGFKNHAGDCYIYYAAAKYLLDYYGIPNLSVERYPSTPEDTHYWLLVNLGSGWYHYDASPKPEEDPFECFMKTDAEIKAYALSRSDGRANYYDYDAALYENYPRAEAPFQE